MVVVLSVLVRGVEDDAPVLAETGDQMVLDDPPVGKGVEEEVEEDNVLIELEEAELVLDRGAPLLEKGVDDVLLLDDPPMELAIVPDGDEGTEYVVETMMRVVEYV